MVADSINYLLELSLFLSFKYNLFLKNLKFAQFQAQHSQRLNNRPQESILKKKSHQPLEVFFSRRNTNSFCSFFASFNPSANITDSSLRQSRKQQKLTPQLITAVLW